MVPVRYLDSYTYLLVMSFYKCIGGEKFDVLLVDSPFKAIFVFFKKNPIKLKPFVEERQSRQPRINNQCMSPQLLIMQYHHFAYFAEGNLCLPPSIRGMGYSNQLQLSNECIILYDACLEMCICSIYSLFN